MLNFNKMFRPAPWVLATALLVFAGSLAAEALEVAKGRPILKITGEISETNAIDRAEFDLEMLENLGTITFTTMTPWFDKPVTFEGVPMRKILAAAGATGQEVVAVALNDYKSIVPMEDVRNFDVIVATKRDGKYMKIRDKGPLFVVYPFDHDPKLHHQMYYGRSVWQLAQLVVR